METRHELTEFERGRAQQKAGDYSAAVTSFLSAVQQDPNNPGPYKSLGDCLLRLKRCEQAIVAYRKALLLEPDSVALYTNLGAAYQEQGDVVAAATAYENVLKRAPTDKYAMNNQGLLLLRENELLEAQRWFERALEVAPAWEQARMNLGIVQNILGNFSAAQESYSAVIESSPEHVDAHINLGMSQLLEGNFEAGWSNYLWRTRSEKKIASSFEVPAWDGTEAREKTVLVHAEQGLGDTIQFARYLPAVRALSGGVVFRVQPALAPLFAEWKEVDTLWVEGEEPVPFDCHVPLMNLPALLHTDVDSVPMSAGYLRPIGDTPQDLRRALPQERSRLRVGLVWAGNPHHANDQRRSCPFELLCPLLSLPNIEWFSLQKGNREGDLRCFPWAGEVRDLSPMVEGFNRTAHAIEALDLVISVDTAIAHLAGAMGTPTWVLLPSVPDWRWFLGTERSIWYQSVRLFRQTRRGDWATALLKLEEALGRLSLDWLGKKG